MNNGGGGAGRSLLSRSSEFNDGDRAGMSTPPKTLQECRDRYTQSSSGEREAPPSQHRLGTNNSAATIMMVELTFVGTYCAPC